MSKSDAVNACSEKTGFLFDPKNDEQWTNVMNYIETIVPEKEPIGWLGLHFTYHITFYSDETDEVLPDFNPTWADGEPSRNDQENCLYVDENSYLRDGYCNDLKFRSICQIEGI